MSESVNDKTTNQDLKEPALFKAADTKKNSVWIWLFILPIIAGTIYWFYHTQDLQIVGQIKADRLVKIGAVLPGVLREISVKNGDFVKQGMVVMSFDNPDISQELNDKTISLEKLNHEMSALVKARDYLEKDFSRMSILYENKVISQSAFELSESSFSQSKEVVAVKQKEIDAINSRINFLKAQITKLKVVAPFSGAVVDIKSDLSGNYLKEGEDVLRLADTSSYYLETGILENHAFRFKVGDKVKVRFDSFPSKVYNGEISKMAPAIHEDVEKVFKIKRLMACSIKLDSMPEEIRYGMQAKVTLHPSH